MSSDPPFLSRDQTGIGQQVAVMTLDCDSAPQKKRHSGGGGAGGLGLPITTHLASVSWYHRL